MSFGCNGRGALALALILGAAVTARAQLTPGPNLLVNPGAEDPLVNGEIPGWTEAKGDLWTIGTADPHTGVAKFRSGNVKEGELTQDIDVTQYLPLIQAGLQAFTFEGWVMSDEQIEMDSARIVVHYNDLFGNPLATYDSGEVQKPVWFPLSNTKTAPPSTRWISVHLHTKLYTGNANGGWFDTLSLRAEATPWESAGPGLAGVAGIPVLVGHGPLTAGSAGSLELSVAKPLILTTLFVSLTSTPTPFKGGVLGAVPSAMELPAYTGLNGQWVVTWDSWAAGIPAGTEFYFQVAFKDAAAIQGVALSNLLKVTQP